MILDTGIFTAFRKKDVSKPGGMPKFETEKITKGYFGILAYETAPVNPTGEREDVETTLRIRVSQNRNITNHSVVVLRNTGKIAENDRVYEVTRAFHGNDSENGQPISDLTLLEVEK